MFASGHRVTTPEAMDVVRMVLVGQVQREIVGLVNAHGPFAVGLSGEDANLFTAEPHRVEVDGEEVDLGLVGDVVHVEPGVVLGLVADGRIPVVSSVARGEGGARLQRQRRHRGRGAGGRARRREAGRAHRRGGAVRRLAGRRERPRRQHDDVVSSIAADELARLLPTLSSGMVPKMDACLRAVRGGVPKAHVIDGRVAHALLVEVFTDQGVGTEVHL